MPLENLFYNIFALRLSLMKQFPSGILPITVSQDRDISSQDLVFKNIVLGTGAHQTESNAMTNFGRWGYTTFPQRGAPQERKLEHSVHNIYIYIGGKLLEIKNQNVM